MIINTYQTKQSTGVSSVQPMSTKYKSSVQLAFSFRSAGVSGELHRRKSTGAQTLGVGSTGVKENRGPTCHICLLPALPASISLLSSRRRRPTRSLRAPPSLRAVAVPPPPPCASAATTVRRSRTLAAPPAQPLCAACARSRRHCRTTPSPPPAPRIATICCSPPPPLATLC